MFVPPIYHAFYNTLLKESAESNGSESAEEGDSEWSSTTLSYLDIKVGIVNSKYSTEVYDKRDDFNFNIVNFPFLCSNIPSGPAYGVYISQLVRIGRICADYSSFALRHCKLTEQLVHQGFRYSGLCKAFDKFARRRGQILDKYGLGVRRHIDDGICLPVVDTFLSRHVSCR